MNKKLSQLKHECFRQEACKCVSALRNQEIITDPALKAKIIDAELHKDLLDENLQCLPNRCQECTNLLC